MNDDYSLRSRATYARIPQLAAQILTLITVTAIAAVLVTPLSVSITAHFAAAEAETTQLDIWWPLEGAPVSGMQPFKAFVPGHPLDSYTMYWSVDGGSRNEMYDSNQDYPHKEALVDLSGWTWKGSGPYQVTLTAVSHTGATIAEHGFHLTVSAATDDAASAEMTETGTGESQQLDETDSSGPTVQAWWPTDGSTVSGTQPFQVDVPGHAVQTYTMYWSVDGGSQNEMRTDYNGAPHKEALVDLSGWDWKGSGPYAITFSAFSTSGSKLAETTVQITTAGAVRQATPQAAQQPAQQVVAETVATVQEPVYKAAAAVTGGDFYLNPSSPAARQVAEWQGSKPHEASLMDVLAGAPTAQWLGGWNADVRADVSRTASAANAAGQRAVFVAYNIPNRDCGSYSAGGVSSGDAYRSWIRSIADGLQGNEALVILEPDALAGMDCLSGSAQEQRIGLVREAAEILTAAGAAVYIDAGHSHWQSVEVMADRLSRAGISRAAGFALNVSNYYHTSDAADFGRQLSEELGGAHFVIDTSRNGQGAKGSEWCNPSGRGVGELPTTQTGDDRIDAYLWVKTPGESDGTCNGGPSAGSWWPEYAVGLVERRAQ